MGYVLGLKCKECGHQTGISPVHVCEACFGPYEVEYDYAKMKGKVTRESISRGPRSLWRYKDLLPVEGQPKTGFHSGFTPLKKAERLGKELGCSNLWIKDDSCNYPTYSYKERVVSVAISKASEFGFDTVGCASTGNLANSTAAHAAQAGIRCFVMIPHDLEQGKVLGSLIFGPTMVRIKGNYDDVNRLCTEIADKYGWAIVNVNLRPYYTEGAKTYGFEIAEQMGWKLPQHTIVPTAGGTILPKIYKGYQEFIQLGLVEDNQPKIYSAQAAGCNPVVTAIQKGVDIIEPQKPNTIAILKRLKAVPNLKVTWATTTPVIDERHKSKRDFDRYNRDVMAYNAVATHIMQDAKVPIVDLYAVVEKAGPERVLINDGVHYTDEGSQILSEPVAALIRKTLST